MQDTTTRAPLDENRPQPRPPWVRMVAIAVAVALIGGILIAAIQGVTNSGADPDPNPGGAAGSNPEPDFSLTDEEAIETFERLYLSSVSAAENLDISILPQVFTDDGPLMERARKRIDELKEDGVQEEIEVRIIEAKVVSSASDEILIDTKTQIHSCFLSEDGKDITEGPTAFEQELTWTLVIEDSRWQIHEGELNDDRVLRKEDDAC